MSMIPNADMRARLAHMHHRGEDGRIRARDHLLRQPVVVDTEDEGAVARVFNSGGAGMYAKPQEYTSKPHTYQYWLRYQNRITKERRLTPPQRSSPSS